MSMKLIFAYFTYFGVCSAALKDPNFKKGVVQGLIAANEHAKSDSCCVKTFGLLACPLSVASGELNPDGSVSCSASPL